ncbi:MAG: hypothetical protein R3C46_03085 [Hyphomonadaceae bacterium]
MIKDFANLELNTESDVEQKLIYQMLNRPEWCNIPSDAIKTKKYVPSFDIGKGKTERRNYSPDYLVFSHGFPVAVLEAKSKNESAIEALQEARMYALALNAKYPVGLNPVETIASCNGSQLVISRWDSDERYVVEIDKLELGSNEYKIVLAALGWSRLEKDGIAFEKKHQPESKRYPISLIGGFDILKQRIGLNTFAEPLAPLMEYYFQALSAAAEQEILEKAYVSSDVITRYERLFEDYLRQRVVPSSDRSGVPVAPQEKGEPRLTEKLWEYGGRSDGAIQLIIGHVGSGKTSFIKRYANFLQPHAMKGIASWVQIDFNEAPSDPGDLQDFVLSRFIDAMIAEGEGDENFYREVYASQIRNFRKLHQSLFDHNREKYEELLADQKTKWFEDKKLTAGAMAQRCRKELKRLLVVVFDNTDKRSRESQVRIFEIAQWFVGLSGAFCIVALRDTTWERHKGEPPLDTLQNATHFYIAPPRFYDVVEKRLKLARQNVERFVPKQVRYDVPGVGTVSYAREKISGFLESLYSDIFRERRLIGIILESLTDRNVRRSLDMFVRMIQSGHLSEANITKTVVGDPQYSIQEHILVRALMRQDYKYFADENGFTTNVADYVAANVRGGIFMRAEILEYLISFRKRPGENGIEGFKQVGSLLSELELIGYSREYLRQELEFMFQRGLVISDDDDKAKLGDASFVRVHASGWAHFTFLIRRMEYVHAIALVSPIGSGDRTRKIADTWRMCDGLGALPIWRQKQIVEVFLAHLKAEYEMCGRLMPLFNERAVGAKRLVIRVAESLEHDPQKRVESQPRLWEGIKDRHGG